MTHHGSITDSSNVHRAHAFEYANAAARTAATGMAPADVGKLALQLDTMALWILSDDSPVTWVGPGVSGTGGAVSSVNGSTGAVVIDADDIDDSATTNKFATAAEITKLGGIEALADVTDATNVNAAGATMNADTTLAGNGYFLDEDTMVSDSATKAASQQSIKAYVDAAVGGAGGVASVNGASGVVVLDADDIDDTSTTNKFTDSADITKLAGIETLADVTDAVNVGSSIHGATAKTTPVDADTMSLIDSAASNVLKKVTWANVKATAKTYFDTLYATIVHAHAGADITSGTVDPSRLGSGASITTKYLRGDSTWQTVATGSVATDPVFDAKGDLAVGTGADTAAKLTVGSNGQRVKADSTQSTGLLWVDEFSTLNFVIDGGGSAITTGIKGDLVVDFACTITAVTTLADQSGSIVVDIWKDTYTNFPPIVGDSITASAKPTLSAATKSQDTTLTGWTTSVVAGDVLRFNVDSITSCTRVTVALKVKRT